MRQQRSGAIINISSMAVLTTYPYVAYKATKAAMVSFTEQLAYQNAQYGIRANVILPGLMNTPMAVDTRAREFGKPRAEIEAMRDAKVPLRKKMGTELHYRRHPSGRWRRQREHVRLRHDPCVLKRDKAWRLQ
jgi:NAD(P)-dependent dehydrogenase (short-subunit alcohol dehydrogenase family)